MIKIFLSLGFLFFIGCALQQSYEKKWVNVQDANNKIVLSATEDLSELDYHGSNKDAVVRLLLQALYTAKQKPQAAPVGAKPIPQEPPKKEEKK